MRDKYLNTLYTILLLETNILQTPTGTVIGTCCCGTVSQPSIEESWNEKWVHSTTNLGWGDIEMK